MPLAPKTALVLAGGGSLGAVQAGMLGALCAAGERLDFIVGASVGAINAGYFAADPTLAGAEVVLSQGPIVEAILASAAIPGIFPPVCIGGRELVDGGIANNTPVST